MIELALRLSGEHVDLAIAELLSVVNAEGGCAIKTRIDEIVLLRCDDMRSAKEVLRRCAFVKEAGLLLGIMRASRESICSLQKRYMGRIEVVRIRGFGKRLGRSAGGCTRNEEGRLRVYIVGSLAIATQPIYERSLEREFGPRAPHRRPMYRPGAMKPHLARLYVNLSGVRGPASTLLDPFCGVGGFLLEACMLGVYSIGMDIDEKAVLGAKANAEFFNCGWLVDVIQGDASTLPLRSGCIDAISTDPPYGRQAKVGAESLVDLISKFVADSLRVIGKEGKVVFAIPIELEKDVESKLVDLGVAVLSKHLDWVHGSLVRALYVVERVDKT
ncbi:MAG: hypothetical protein DRO39_03385 [Thermoprotei archaeon]|nr:MAG: hypothetical protein DRO39_03385 [Thermoprotei archaeon]